MNFMACSAIWMQRFEMILLYLYKLKHNFIVMAKRAVEENKKDIAAVLACASLEDTLKKYGELNGLDVYEKEMNEVVGMLKSKGLVKGPRGKILDSFTTVRNKAFHAQWDKIVATEVQSIIAFVEEFLVKEFGVTEEESQDAN
jgi:hypothetical protein